MKNHADEETKAKIAKLKAEGKSTREVALEVGMSHKSVWAWFRKIDENYVSPEYNPSSRIMPHTAEYDAWFYALNPITGRKDEN